jgi:two-component system nitrogen regulation response regulator GlnG
MLAPTRQPRQPDSAPATQSENFDKGVEKTRATILVVDDEWLVRWALSEGLGAAGYGVVIAQDARGALNTFQRARPVDAVLLDLRLPDCHDLALLKRLKQIEPRCPIILITVHRSQELIEQARQAGAYRVVDKPFDVDTVIALVGEALDATRRGGGTPS